LTYFVTIIQDQTVGDPMVTANSPLPSPKIPMAPSDQVFY